MDKQYRKGVRRTLKSLGPSLSPSNSFSILFTSRATLRATLKKVANWKTPGHDGIHGFWFKKFTFIHERLAIEIKRCLEETDILKWKTKGKTTLIQKDPQKWNTHNNYRPITCQPMVWEILTTQIREEICYLTINCRLFPEVQKECHKGTRGASDILYID